MTTNDDEPVITKVKHDADTVHDGIKDWRAKYKVHPAAEVFPMMEGKPLAELAKSTVLARGPSAFASELLAAITVLLLFSNPCEAFLSAFEPWGDLQCLTEIVDCRIELAKRLVGLATPA
jgi:hypothetical protein